MKLTILAIAVLFATVRSQPPCKPSNACSLCEPRDCDIDADCEPGLLCADAHKPELRALNFDARKADCGNLGRSNWELCFDAGLLEVTDPPTPPPVAEPNDISCRVNNPCTKCEVRDCDVDEECDGYLICADAHKQELANLGFDPRKADCGDLGLWNWELCFDPMLLEAAPCEGVTCPEGESCDIIDGVCKPVDSIRPCIAVIDESDNFTDDEIDDMWAAFRSKYPERLFCLLRPLNPNSSSGLYLPTNPDFLSDPRTTFADVSRDEGDPNAASDWFSICGYDSLTESDIAFVALFIDNSGSMYTSTVAASFDLFQQNLASAGLDYCTVENSSEDWITLFDTTLGDVGGGADCVIS